jgi:hypothetical protein
MPIIKTERIQLKQPEGDPIQAWLVTSEDIMTDFALSSLLKAEADRLDQEIVEKKKEAN